MAGPWSEARDITRSLRLLVISLAEKNLWPTYTDINPMVLAAQLERVEIIDILYRKCCPMIHALTADRHKCLFPMSCYICHVKVNYIGQQTIEECRAAVQVYRALTTPAFLFHAGVEDPILETFVISNFLQKREGVDPAFAGEYDCIAVRCRQFATKMLDLCRSASEVKTLLGNDTGIEKTHRKHVHEMKYPRLLLAISYNQKEFVSHPMSQQLLQNVWYKGLPPWVCHERFHYVRLALYSVLMLICMPITVSLYLFRVPFVERFVKPAVNKFILDLCSFIIFLILIFLKVSRNERPLRGEGLGPLDVFIFIWVIGFTVRYFGVSARRRGNWLAFSGNAENSDWRFHEFLQLLCFWIYYMIMIVLMIMTKVSGNVIKDRRELDTWDSYLIGEAAFAVASILTVIQIYSFFKVSSILGPLQVSMKKMIFDVLSFLVLFGVVLSAFAFGMSFLYEGYHGYTLTDPMTNTTIEEQGEFFDGLERSYKTLFWNIFGYGEVEHANLVLEPYSINKTTGDRQMKTHRFNEILGYAIYGIYHITVVVVLLNMLIAMMANSYNNIEANADLEWKYARARLIMNYIDETGVLVAPFNLLPIRFILAFLGSKCGRCALFRKNKPEKAPKDCKALMERLKKRYWKARKRAREPKGAGPFTGNIQFTEQSPFIPPTHDNKPVIENVGHNIIGSTLSDSGT